MSDFEKILYVLSFAAGVLIAVNVLYTSVKDWVQAKKHKVLAYIPYLNFYVKPMYIYSSISLAFVLAILFFG